VMDKLDDAEEVMSTPFPGRLVSLVVNHSPKRHCLLLPIVSTAHARGQVVTAVTNGAELQHFRHLLAPGLLQDLQITLDGTSKLHDRRRVGPGFKQTFDLIAANIDMALAQGVRISLRMNVDSTNAAEVGPLGDFCRERGWADHPKFSSNAAAVTPEGKHKPLITKAELVRMTSYLSRERNSPFYSYERVATETLAQCLNSDGYPFKTVANCSAESGLLMFDPQGDVYACWEEIGMLDARIGVYGEEGLSLFPEIATRWLSRFPGAIEECSRCPYALIHTSGCARHAYNHTGTVFSSACESFQEYFPETLALAYDAFEAELLGVAPKANAAVDGGQQMMEFIPLMPVDKASHLSQAAMSETAMGATSCKVA